MAYCGDQGSYHAYYPQSWTVYNLPGQNVKLTCNQVSPIMPHDYKDTSLPLALFNWTIENQNETDIDFSLMFTWQSGSGSDRYELTDVLSESFDINEYDTKASGVLIHQKLKKMNLDYCIAAKNTVRQIFFCCFEMD
jgi:non-lysosomal glucosylceramidase